MHSILEYRTPQGETTTVGISEGCDFSEDMDTNARSHRRLLYEGAAAEVAGTMLSFLNSHAKGRLSAVEAEKLQRQIQKALWLHPKGSKEGVEEAVAYLTLVLTTVYGLPLKPLHADQNVDTERLRPMSPSEAKPPEARSPAMLPQPYSSSTAAPAGVHLTLASAQERPVHQDAAVQTTQTTAAQGIQAGKGGNFAGREADSAARTGLKAPSLSNNAHLTARELPSASVYPRVAEAPIERHLDGYYLAAVGRKLEVLKDLMDGHQISDAQEPAQADMLCAARGKPVGRHGHLQDVGRGEHAKPQSSRSTLASPQELLSKQAMPSGSKGSTEAPAKATLSHQQTPVSAAAELQKEKSDSDPAQQAAMLQQLQQWGQGAWMEQLAAVVAAAASAASAAVQAQTAPHHAVLPRQQPLRLDEPHNSSVQPEDSPQDVSNSAAAGGAYAQASRYAEQDRACNESASAALQPARQSWQQQSQQQEAQKKHRNRTQTEVQLASGHSIRAASVAQMENGVSWPLHRGSPMEAVAGVPVSSPEETNREENASNQTGAARSEEPSRATTATVRGPEEFTRPAHLQSTAPLPAHVYGVLPQAPMMQALQYPAILRWPPSIHAPSNPLAWQQLPASAPPATPQAQLPSGPNPLGKPSACQENKEGAGGNERVDELAGSPVFDYSVARAALQELQKAPDRRAGAAGVKWAPRVPSAPSLRPADVRKRSVLPPARAAVRPVTPPGFAPPPAPKRPHLAFGTRAAPPAGAPTPGTHASPALVPRVASLDVGNSKTQAQAPRQKLRAHRQKSKGEASHRKPAMQDEAQKDPPPATQRHAALRALAALLLQPETLLLLRPSQDSTSCSSSEADQPPMARPQPLPSLTVAPGSSSKAVADRATQYSPYKEERGTSMAANGQPAMANSPPPRSAEQVPPHGQVEGCVRIDKEVQADLGGSEAAELATLRASLVEHIAEAVASRLLDSRSSAPEPGGYSVQHVESAPVSATDAQDADTTSNEVSRPSSERTKSGSSPPPANQQVVTSIQPTQPRTDTAERSPRDANQKAEEQHPTGNAPAEEDAEQARSNEQAKAGSWWEQWRGRLSEQEMEQATQEVIAEELAQLLDTWDGASGSLPAALRGLAQHRSHSTAAPAFRSLPGSLAFRSQELDASGPAMATYDVHAMDKSQQGAGPSAEQPGEAAQSMQQVGAATEAARGVQKRVHELLKQQEMEEEGGGEDPLLQLVLEALAEVSLEQLRVPGSLQRAASGHDRQLSHQQACTSHQWYPAVSKPAPPLWGGNHVGTEHPVRAGLSGSSPARAWKGSPRMGRTKSLERLKLRRRAAQRRGTANAPVQSDAAVQTAVHADCNAHAQGSRQAHEYLPSSGERAAVGLWRAHAEMAHGAPGHREFGSSLGFHTRESRPVSPALPEQPRMPACPEDEDGDGGWARNQRLRLLRQPEAPNGPWLYHEGPSEHLEDASDEGDTISNHNWSLQAPPRIPSPPVQQLTRREVYAARRRRLVAEAGLIDPLLFSSTSTSATTSLSESFSALMGDQSHIGSPAHPLNSPDRQWRSDARGSSPAGQLTGRSSSAPASTSEGDSQSRVSSSSALLSGTSVQSPASSYISEAYSSFSQANSSGPS